MKSATIIWFRNDLRLHDHEALSYALKHSESIIPVYIFDDRQFKTTSLFNLAKTGNYRTQFLIESVQDLKQNLISKGSNLIIKRGLPEDILPELCKQYLVKELVYHKEVAPEELAVENKVNAVLLKIGVETTSFSSATLIHHDDLPFPLLKMPPIFTKYRNLIELNCSVRALFKTPDHIPSPEFQYLGEIPKMKQLGQPDFIKDSRAALDYYGGESAAIARLNNYIWENDCLKSYEQTRNGMLGSDYSSKFSAWLSLGCISPKYVFNEAKRYENERIKNKSTYWLIFELHWRDFFRFTATRHFNRFFAENGVENRSECDWKVDFEMFEKWKQGRTGFPFIDANMRELMLTGYMSNRGRQNVASFLVKDLKVNWLMGAEYFESLLIDYDVCSNYGNWAYIAGVGQDPRENRHFNIFSQSERYDHDANYMKHWLPELAHLDSKMIHQFHTLGISLKKHLKVDTYPEPILIFNTQEKKQLV
jgi:deoxyribodipyrimidine photo-lyase